jgi:hypothetical protein
VSGSVRTLTSRGSFLTISRQEADDLTSAFPVSLLTCGVGGTLGSRQPPDNRHRTAHNRATRHRAGPSAALGFDHAP